MTAKSILDQLDQAASEFKFPMLDNGYVYPADVRLNIYRDATRWLMIIELLGAYNSRVSGLDSFQNCLHVFGNALGRKCGTRNEDFLYPIDSLAEDPLFENQYEWYIKPGASSLSVRGQKISFDLSERALGQRGITLIDPPKIDPAAVLRCLLPEHRELLLASEEELAVRNERQLPKWMRLEEWFHPDLAGDSLPSNCETFQMLAEAIATGRIDAYHPTRQPNTRWQSWPEGGKL